MTTGISVRKTVVVNVSQARAFEVFAHQQSTWWPKMQCLGDKPLQQAVLEPRAGGRWHEVDANGNQCDWGKVLAYEPPSRLLLAWQISSEWKYDPDIYTEVDVRFVPDGENRTIVELEHRGLEAYGENAEQMRAIFETPNAWQGMLESFAAATR